MTQCVNFRIVFGMNVLIISLKLGEHSGANTLSRSVIDGLRAQGVAVSVCAEVAGEVPFPVTTLESVSGRSTILAFLRNMMKVRRAVKNVQAVHAMDGWPYAIYGWWAVLGTSKRLFISGVGTYSVAPFYIFGQRWLTRRAFARAANVFCISDYTKEQIAKAGVSEKKLLTVLMGNSPLPEISADEREAFSKKYAIDSSRHPIVLTVGAIKTRKGQLETFKAVEILKKKYPSILYIAVGSTRNAYAEQMKSYAAERGLSAHLRVVSDADERALAYFYSTCTVFALNSFTDETYHHFEGFGLVIVEGYQFGKPAVGSRGCGIESAIQDGKTGLLTEQQSPADIAEKIQTILDSYDVYSKNASALYPSFTWPKTTATYKSYYFAK